MIEDLLLLVCTHLAMFWVGYKFGLHQAVLRIVRNFINDPDEIRRTFAEIQTIRDGLEDQQDEDVDSVDVTAEWVGDEVYVYREDTGEFLAQGKSVEAAIKSIPPGPRNVNYNVPEDMVNKPQAVQP